MSNKPDKFGIKFRMAVDVETNVPSKSLLSVRGMKGRVSSGGYSNSGTRGKDFQKLMFSKKKGVLILSLSFLSQT